MAFWDADLETRMGAETAADAGGMASFVFAGLSVLGAVIFGGLTSMDTTEAIGGAVAVGIQVLIGIVAGFRLRAGKGAFWGIAVAALLAIELLFKLATFAISGGLVINVILLVVVVQGIRGAFALRGSFAEDEIEAFE